MTGLSALEGPREALEQGSVHAMFSFAAIVPYGKRRPNWEVGDDVALDGGFQERPLNHNGTRR
jgi:hypothetical protein